MLAPCACTTVRKAGRTLLRIYDNAFAGAGLTVTQFAILRALEREEPLELSRLADAMVLERTSLYRMIAPLETMGVVSLNAGSTPRRRSASLTDLGRSRLTELAPVWEEIQSQVVGRLGAERWAAVAPFLQDLPRLLEDLT